MKIVDINGVEINDKYFEALDKEFKKEHPIFYWIDHSFFKENGLIGYAPHYVLTHPQLIIEEVLNQTKWAWQRVYRGWDDRVVWSIDDYLSKMIPQWIKQLKEVKHGIPIEMFDSEDWDEEKSTYIQNAEERAEKKWDNILDQIIDGFEAYEKMKEKYVYEDLELKNKFENGFNLFMKYFSGLWD
jgi:hypothetical protein